MPLHDHFHPPFADECPWESFHSAWANAIVLQLNRETLLANYRATPQVHVATRRTQFVVR